MDTSKLKKLTGNMSILKDYSSLVVPVVILLAAVSVFVVSLLMGSTFKEEIVKASVPNGRTVKNLTKSAVSSEQWEVEQKYQQAYETDANEIAEAVFKKLSRAGVDA